MGRKIHPEEIPRFPEMQLIIHRRIIYHFSQSRIAFCVQIPDPAQYMSRDHPRMIHRLSNQIRSIVP